MHKKVGYFDLLGAFQRNRGLQFQHPRVYFLNVDHRIVQFSVDDPNFQETVLPYENVEDFLVDERLTITYLTNAGELVQVNPTDASFKENRVNLKAEYPDVTYWTSLLEFTPDRVILTGFQAGVKKNRFILVGPPADGRRTVLDSVEVPSAASRVFVYPQTNPSIL